MTVFQPTYRAAVVLAAVFLFGGCAAPLQQGSEHSVLAPPTAAETAPTATITRGATVEGITEYTLSNGLRVLLFPDLSKPTATVNVTYFVGSRHEAYGETGMAHLLEHLVFKGTPRYPNIPQELTQRGARPNGTTWYDRTNYFETFPATNDNLEWALDLEADRMVNSFISKEDLDSEMTVVRNEFEMGENSPFRVLMQRTLGASFLWHNYGKSTIGARADLENVPIERLQAFYRRYYQPDNAMLVVAGKFEDAHALETIEKTFGVIPRPERSLDRGTLLFPTYTREPTQDGEREVTVRRVGDTQVLMAAYRLPAGSHEEFAALDVLGRVLGDTPSGRLHQALVVPNHAASMGTYGLQLAEPGVLLAYAEVRETSPLEVARKEMIRTLEGIAERPITSEEVERAKTMLLKNIELTMNNSERVALQLSEWAATADWRLMFIHRDRIEAVTPEMVQEVATRYLKPANRTIGMFIPSKEPDRAEIPDVPDFAALVGSYTGRTDLAQGEAFDPSTANIDARTQRVSLPNGFSLALLPKETRGNTVVARISLRIGSEAALTGRARDGELAGSMLMRGTRTKTRQQVKDEFDRLKAQASVGGSATQVFAAVETTRENLPGALRLIGEILHEPAFDTREWEEMKQERLASIESQKSDPSAIGSNVFNREISPRPKGHPFYSSTFDELVDEIEAVRLEDAKRFYQEFYGAQAGQMAVVGDFDAEEVEGIVREIFADWKSTQPFARVINPYREVAPVDRMIETPDKANAFFMAGLTVPMSDTGEDYPAMMLANYMIGGGFLNSRLATRIRQQEGISYGVGSGFSASAEDERGSWSAYAIYAPENLERLETVFRDEIRKVLEDGFTPDEIRAAKEGYLQSRQLNRAQDGSLAAMLVSDLYLQRTRANEADFEEKVAALTADQLRDALRRHLDPDRLVIVKAGDFAKHRE